MRQLDYRRFLREVQDAEARFAQSLLREEEAAEARRKAHQERLEQERRLAEERAKREEEERRAREAQELQARLMSEEAESNKAIRQLSKPCPSCRRPIQKNGGWSRLRRTFFLECGKVVNPHEACICKKL
ncbi:hypothetical protein AAE478_010254 [Parahypoxylon ruwenzoriense]